MQSTAKVIILAVMASVFAVTIYAHYFLETTVIYQIIQGEQQNQVKLANYISPSQNWTAKIPLHAPNNFTAAAKIASKTVVHIKESTNGGGSSNSRLNDILEGDNWYDYLNPYEDSAPIAESSGSGVIISNDGFIVTNRHVVENLKSIEVTLSDKSSYTAKLVGMDSATDIALLRINNPSAPFISFANSDSLEVGEWVLAVGNPFNLTSTVTAGIVSAKGRDMNILADEYAIESFIQTDAAVNPGNSGGALVNTRGELVGINTAIATSSGTYEGYSFAVPINIVSKVVNDLQLYGEVKRACLGVNIQEINGDFAKRNNLNSLSGVFVEYVIKGSSADQAGITKGDIIIAINGIDVNSGSEMNEKLGRYHPGDPIAISLVRNAKPLFLEVTLLSNCNYSGQLKSLSKGSNRVMGVTLEEIPLEEIRNLGLRNGVRVSKIEDGQLKSSTAMRANFIITRINNKTIRTIDDILIILHKSKVGDGLMIEGNYHGEKGKTFYAFSLKEGFLD